MTFENLGLPSLAPYNFLCATLILVQEKTIQISMKGEKI